MASDANHRIPSLLILPIYSQLAADLQVYLVAIGAMQSFYSAVHAIVKLLVS